MIKLIKNSEVETTLAELKPNKIAVAYLGKEWSNFVCLRSLKEIIASPTLGCNPEAVSNVVKKLGWSKVHFLDNLHAKIYLNAKNECAIGSFNLSKNGIHIEGLEEMGVLIRDPEIYKQASGEYERLKELATKKYDCEAKKEKVLQELYKTHNRAARSGLIKPIDDTLNFNDYKYGIDQKFNVSWYCTDTVNLNYKTLNASNPLLTEDTFNDRVEEYLTIAEDDEIELNTWVLIWKANIDGFPHKTKSHIKWLYIDYVIPHGTDDAHEPYTKLILQMKSENTSLRPSEPFNLNSFKLNDKLRESIIKSLSEASMEDLRFNKDSNSNWLLKNISKETIKKFLDLVSNNLEG